MYFFLFILTLFNGIFQKYQCCKLDNETCECNTLNNPIEMKCIKEIKNASLDFDKIVIETFNKSLILNIQNKVIFRIYTLNVITNIDKLYLTSLNINQNKISRIEADSFKGLISLEILSLFNNEIETVDINSFNGLGPTLTKLDLYTNKIQMIQNGTYNRLTRLEYLKFQVNQITEVEKYSFNNMTNLKQLFLYSNKIKQVKNNTYINLIKLDWLRFDRNEITDIDINAFLGNENLKQLYFYSNKIKRIKYKTFNNLAKLEYLFMDKNEIKDIDAYSFTGCKSLKIINLQTNKIESLSENLFADFQYIEEINLSFNNLILIPGKTFKNLPRLKLLDLSHNFLDGLSGKSFYNLSIIKTVNLGYNSIRIINKEYFGESFLPLNILYLNNNGIKLIEDFSFSNLINLIDLHLEFNNLESINKKAFYNLKNLETIYLNSNKISNFKLIKDSLNYLINLKSIDLSNNFITEINDNDFDFNTRLNSINLNNNLIKHISNMTLNHLNNLKSFNLKQNQLDIFDLNMINFETIVELDLSFNKLFLKKFLYPKNLEVIKLEMTEFINSNYSYEIFINTRIKILDFSNINIVNFKIFDALKNLTNLSLSRVNLQSMSVINFQNFVYLSYLNLSFNNLTELQYNSFSSLIFLEYLDLSYNRISFIDAKIFASFTPAKVNPLRYLNLEHNQIVLINCDFVNYLSLSILILSNNLLIDFPAFLSSKVSNYSKFNSMFFYNNNNIKRLKSFDSTVYNLKILNLDFNKLESIEHDALVNLKRLEYLAMSYNNLGFIQQNNFNCLFSVKFLNLSYNQIKYIEIDSFKNMNKLTLFDLSYNNLVTIENYIFNGLSNLNDLYLMSEFRLQLNRNSFVIDKLTNMSNIGDIFLNETVVNENICLFETSFTNRDIQRNIGKKYKFLKSINLITWKQNNYALTKEECELTFQFLQFKMHFNLRSDLDNELFEKECKNLLVLNRNTYKNNLRKCKNQNEENLAEFDSQAEKFYLNKFKLIFTNYYYLLTTLLLFCLALPISFLIGVHLYNQDAKNEFLNKYIYSH